MKAESTTLAEQKDICHEEKETDLEFSFWFSVAVLTCLYAGFVFIGSRLVLDPFSELTLTWGP